MTTGVYVGGARDGQTIPDVAPSATRVTEHWRNNEVWEENYLRGDTDGQGRLIYDFEPPALLRGTTQKARSNCSRCSHFGHQHSGTMSGPCKVCSCAGFLA